MCGIVGIVRLDGGDVVEESRVKRMRDVLRHRGPDGEGLWLEGPVGLGHRWLSIVDVAGGQQPMSNEDGAVWITYNGEIYNHAALRPGLEAKGHRYQTRSDTETILHLYEEEGDACVEKLQGMFAFALWDRKAQRLLLARDRLGIKPLYFAVNDRGLLFASEIKPVLAALMTRMASDRIRTFAVGFDDPASNELPFARIAARAVGAQHHEVLLSGDEFFRALPRLIWHEDEPIAFPSSIALHFVSQLARSHVKVVLTGEGADELFLGYNWYRLTAWNEALGRRYWAWTPPAARRGIPRAGSRLARALRPDCRPGLPGPG